MSWHIELAAGNGANELMSSYRFLCAIAAHVVAVHPRRKWYIPGLANVQDVDSVGASLPEVRLHVHLHVLGTKVALGAQEHLNVLAGGVERGGKVLSGHLDCWCCRE
jgi:hypothetical protein